MIDRVEVGRPASPRLRVAFEVSDAEGATRALVDAGAELVAPPTRTPWDSLNARLGHPAACRSRCSRNWQRLPRLSPQLPVTRPRPVAAWVDGPSRRKTP
jgi:hypothetical protein